jgi:hypothetical protein
MFPSGRITTEEHPRLLADTIRELAAAHGGGEA